MAIAPIDLQTLFTQVDKIGKQEAAQKTGAAVQQAVLLSQSQQQTEDKIRSVNEAQGEGEGTEGVRDKNGRKASRGDTPSRKKDEKAEGEKPEGGVIRDPALGKNINISL